MCCENIEDVPQIMFTELLETILERLVGKRQLLISECQSKDNKDDLLFAGGCVLCPNFEKKSWKSTRLICYVNISIYPAPCQCRCVYCTTPKNNKMNTIEVREGYEKLFKIIKLLDDSGLVVQNALWQVLTGEITIHPYKEQLFLQIVLFLMKGLLRIYMQMLLLQLIYLLMRVLQIHGRRLRDLTVLRM